MKNTFLMSRKSAGALGFGLALLFLLCLPVKLVAEGGHETETPPPTLWQVTGPIGGDVRALAVDPKDPKKYYFGTLDGQLYSTADTGKTWRLLYNFNLPQLYIDGIVVDARDSRTLYVATHKHRETGGFYKSSDGGQTWREMPDLKNEPLFAITQSTGDPDTIVVGGANGVFRSNDSGETWKKISQDTTKGIVNVESLAVDPRNAETIYAGTWYLPYKTTDGGSAWRNNKQGMIEDSDVFAIEIDPQNANHIIASACSGIYDSSDSGDNWRKIQGIPSSSRRTRAIMIHPTMSNVILAGTTEGFWRSEDGGKSWMMSTQRQLEINSIAVHPSTPNVVMIGTNNYGVMISTDAAKTWTMANVGYSGRFVNNIVPDNKLSSRIYATSTNTTTGGGFFYISEDGGHSWQPSMRNMSNRVLTYSILQDPVNPEIIYLGTNLGLYRSQDRGNSWMNVATDAPKVAASKNTKRAPAPRAADPAAKKAQAALNAAGYDVGVPDGKVGVKTKAQIRKYQTDKNLSQTGVFDNATLASLDIAGAEVAGQKYFLNEGMFDLAQSRDGEKTWLWAAAQSGVYRSADLNEGWEKVDVGDLLAGSATSLTVAPDDSKIVWVGTTRAGLLKTTDGGKTWTHIAGVPNYAPISVVRIDPQRHDYLYVGTLQSLYYSHDGGKSWTRPVTLPYGTYRSVIVNPRNPDEIMVGNAYQHGAGGALTSNGGGVWRSTDAGASWTRVDPRNANLPSQRIWALALDSDSRLLVGTHSAGIYLAERQTPTAVSSNK